MDSNNSNGRRAAWARGFAALGAVLAMELGLMARPAEAAPFAYVTNQGDGTVSVIDTATNPPSVVATVTVGSDPVGVGVTPDGKHVYVTNGYPCNTVSVIDTATNPPSVVATVAVGLHPLGVAVTPDGKHVYVANRGLGNESNTVSVIATATNTVEAATITVGNGPLRGRRHPGWDTRLCDE
jgi:YVTN family beta-propeller protein